MNDGALPLAPGRKLYVEGVDATVAASFGEIVTTPEEADLAVIRLQAPFEERETMFENFFHAGSLAFSDDVVAHVRAVAAVVPTVVDVLADRPPILTPIVEVAAAVTVNWGPRASRSSTCSAARSPPRGGCRSTCRGRWPPSRPPVPMCRSTPPIRCSGSVMGSRSSPVAPSGRPPRMLRHAGRFGVPASSRREDPRRCTVTAFRIVSREDVHRRFLDECWTSHSGSRKNERNIARPTEVDPWGGHVTRKIASHGSSEWNCRRGLCGDAER